MAVTLGVYAVGDDLEGINIQARVCFVEYGEVRFEYRHLKYFIALLSRRPENPSLTPRDRKGLIELHEFGLFAHEAHKSNRVDFFFATFFAARVQRSFQQGKHC